MKKKKNIYLDFYQHKAKRYLAGQATPFDHKSTKLYALNPTSSSNCI